MIWRRVSSEMADPETVLLPGIDPDSGLRYLYRMVAARLTICADCATEKLHDHVSLLYTVAEGIEQHCELCGTHLSGSHVQKHGTERSNQDASEILPTRRGV